VRLVRCFYLEEVQLSFVELAVFYVPVIVATTWIINTRYANLIIALAAAIGLSFSQGEANRERSFIELAPGETREGTEAAKIDLRKAPLHPLELSSLLALR
jgi:hypothetical protein